VKLRLALVAICLCGCGDVERELQVVPALTGCVPPDINSVQLVSLGDFPPAPVRSISTSPMGTASLSLPGGTRVLEIDGLGPTGLLAFGRTAPLELGQLGPRVAVNYGAPNSLCAAGDMSYARGGHQATLLPSGSVLLSGGHDRDGFPVTKLELYVPFGDPQTPAGRFRIVDPTGPTVLDSRAVLGHAVAVLPGGDFLITGGAPTNGGRPLGGAYPGFTHHAADGTLIGSAGVLTVDGRAYHSATVLGDGRVILIGGCSRFDAGGCPADAVLGDSAIFNQGQWSAGPPLLYPRYGHQALLRGDGKIWIVGGGPMELFDPDGASTDEGDLLGGVGQAALLPTGAVLVVGDQSAALGFEGETAPLGAMPSMRAGHTVTVLEDGSALVAGGAGDPTLVLFDPVLGPQVLPGPFIRREHTATRLTDGSILLAGGAETGGASGKASIFLHNPLGPFANLPTLTFESTASPLVPRRPDRLRFAAGRGELTATARADGRPAELALVGALDLGDLQLLLTLGREGEGSAAVILSWQSDAHHAFVSLTPGQPVTLSTVRSGVVAIVCSGESLAADELPDVSSAGTPLAPLTVNWRTGHLEVYTPSRSLLKCTPGEALGRGAVGVGALSGKILFDDLTLTR
jgi:hypothetical protein